jgi:N-acetylmuramoyl-L-alanine amidase
MMRGIAGFHFKALAAWTLVFLVFSGAGLAALSLDETINSLSCMEGAGEKQAEFRWDPFFQTGVFSLNGHYISFFTGSGPDETGYVLLDNSEVFSSALPFPDGGELFFPDAFSAVLQTAFSRAIREDAGRFRIAAIIIDPGHGGKDPGASSAGEFSINGKTFKAIEKDIALDVSKRLRTVLNRAYPGKRILMTRDRDTYPSLDARTAIANSVPLRENEAIIFISIHANKTLKSNPDIRGYEVLYLHPNVRRDVIGAKTDGAPGVTSILNDMMQEEYTTESIMIGQSILRSFGEVLGPSVPSRGLKAGEWMVVKNARMPAILVELGFLDNRDDVILMTTEEGLQKLIEALYKGIEAFINAFEHSGGFTAVR